MTLVMLAYQRSSSRIVYQNFLRYVVGTHFQTQFPTKISAKQKLNHDYNELLSLRIMATDRQKDKPVQNINLTTSPSSTLSPAVG